MSEDSAAQPKPPAQPVPPVPVPAPPPAAQPAPQKPVISYEDFSKLDLCVARIVEAHAHPNADKLLCLTVDLGGSQRQIIAGIRGYYDPETLAGKSIVVLANLQPRKMRGLESNGMLLAASKLEDGALRDVVLLTVDRDVPPGSPVS